MPLIIHIVQLISLQSMDMTTPITINLLQLLPNLMQTIIQVRLVIIAKTNLSQLLKTTVIISGHNHYYYKYAIHVVACISCENKLCGWLVLVCVSSKIKDRCYQLLLWVMFSVDQFYHGLMKTLIFNSKMLLISYRDVWVFQSRTLYRFCTWVFGFIG